MAATTAEILGVRRKRGSRLDLARQIEEGLQANAIDRVKENLALGDTQVSLALGVSTKTLGRLRKGRSRLSPTVGDRLYRLARVFELAREVLEDDEAAREWIREPQLGLGYRTPLDLIRTEIGFREVEDLLGRMEYGVLS
jgi:putative toxin-antitoxin system antitoxin component (TIGR02293 family)